MNILLACDNSSILNTILFIKRLIDIIFIVAPIILVLMLTIDIAKNVMSKDDEENKRNVYIAIKRIVYCLVLFFVPAIIDGFMSYLDSYNVNFATCYDKATEENVDKLYQEETARFEEEEAKKDKEREANAQKIKEEQNKEEEDTKTAVKNAKKKQAQAQQNQNSSDNGAVSNSNVHYKGKAKRSKTYSSKTILDTITKEDFTSKITIKAKAGVKISQSFTVVGNYFVVNNVSSGSNSTYLTVYNKYTGKKVNSFDTNFGHANGSGYNTSNGNIYVTHGESSRSKVHRVPTANIESRTSLKASTISTPRNVSGAGYDAVKNKFYFASGGGIYNYSGGSMSLAASRKNYSWGGCQDFGVHDGIIYDARIKSETAIDLYKTSGGYLGSYKIKMSGLELEGVEYYGEGKKMAVLFNNYGNKENYIYIIDTIIPD